MTNAAQTAPKHRFRRDDLVMFEGDSTVFRVVEANHDTVLIAYPPGKISGWWPVSYVRPAGEDAR